MKVLWFLLLSAIPIHAADVRNNGGNCIGVKSCRPRCVTFQVERDVQNCASSRGIFAVEGDINPWDIKQFRSRNCISNGSCENNLCGQSLSGDMTVRIGEEGHHGSYFFTNVYLPDGGNDRFTFCSAYPCTKEECALPEQMVSSSINIVDKFHEYLSSRVSIDRDLLFNFRSLEDQWTSTILMLSPS
jgi:hypothetical protein